MKSKACNQFNTHIDLCVRMFEHTFFTLENFTYDQAIVAWKKKKAFKVVEA
jgi:hypothetical protein